MMVVLGGSGSISGCILAAIVLTILPEGLRFMHLGDWRMVIYSLILILMMLLRPEGLLGNREIWRLQRRVVRSES
jgi:branched-chain amino acid transport system permease protein